LMRESGLDGFATYGITLEQRGALFDSRYRPGARGLMEFTDVGKHLPTEALKDAYSKLSVADRYRLIDLLFEPNGYTLVAFREAGFAKFDPSGRVAANRIRVAGLK